MLAVDRFQPVMVHILLVCQISLSIDHIIIIQALCQVKLAQWLLGTIQGICTSLAGSNPADVSAVPYWPYVCVD